MSLKLASADQPAAGLRQAGSRLHAVERRPGRANRAVLHQPRLLPVDAVSIAMVRRRDGDRGPGGDRAVLGIIVFRKRISGVFVSDHHARPRAAGAAGGHRRPADHQRLQRPDRPWRRSRSAASSSIRIRMSRPTIWSPSRWPCPDRRAYAGGNPRRPYPAGDPRRPEPRPLSGLRRAGLSDVLLRGFRAIAGLAGMLYVVVARVRLAHVHGPELLHHAWWSGLRSAAAARCSAPASAPS